MSITETTRSANTHATPNDASSAGLSDSLNGHDEDGIHTLVAVEGQDSPQATVFPVPNDHAPAGGKVSRSQGCPVTQTASVAADQGPPAAIYEASPNDASLLADPLLALAADVLGDLEKVRIANENRLRQLTRSAEDSDGEDGRGWGLDLAHPAVSRLAALIHAMKCDSNVVIGLTGEKTPKKKGCCLEHDAERNLAKMLADNPLGPWVAAQKGIGEKQGARLLAAIGDPYIRPEITREDGTVEPSRPRLVSELWAYAGYHVVPAGHPMVDAHHDDAGGELNGSGPGHTVGGAHSPVAGVAPKRQRGQHANWSAAAKMRAFLVAESCIKQSGTSHRAVYDATRAKYAEAVHAAECIRCGPKNKPAQPGSPLSDGHKHARALRAVAKEILRDLWREARRIHQETSAGGHIVIDPQTLHATSGNSSIAGAAA